MPIKVAYDISVLGNYSLSFDYKTGIFRVTEDVLHHLSMRNDVEMTGMGLCDEDPVFSTFKCWNYVKNFADYSSYKFSETFKSRLKLEKFYNKIYMLCLLPKLQVLSDYSIPSISVLKGLSLLFYLQKLDARRFFNYKNYDIFHSPYYQLPPEDLTGGIPRVLTIHDLIPFTATQFVSSTCPSNFREIIESINFDRDWIICNSKYTKEEFCEYTKMSPSRVFVTHLAAANYFHPVTDSKRIAAVRQRYGIPEGDYFLCLARQLEPRKNLPYLIRCFFHLLSEQPNMNISLVLAGSKRYRRNDVLTVVEGSSHFSSKVVFTDYIPDDEDLSAIYSGAKAFIFTSLCEGFGLPVLEAMQCGIPVIAFNTTSLPELLGDAGILVKPTDEDALCQAMLDLLNNTDLCKQLSQKGIERAKKFSWAKCAAQTVEVYQQAVSNK
jgi:glycosyltransferase involved in cell wall biosynthesis